MTQAISRDSFDELKNYLGVYLQQGRAILDSDWNENQDIAVSFMRRLSGEALGTGSPNRGFKIDPVFPPPPELLLAELDTTGLDFEEALAAVIGACIADLLVLGLYLLFGPILFFLQFPGRELEPFERLDGFELSSTQGALRIGRDRPAAGEGFLRLSGHPGTVTVAKTLDDLVDLSAFELATFRYRLNEEVPGTITFFVEDDNGDRNVWHHENLALAADLWLSGFAAPLDLRFRVLTERLRFAVKDESYSAELFTFGGKTPMTWSLAGGALPAGLTLTAAGSDEDSAKGRLSGTPTQDGSFSFKVQVVDAGGATTTAELTLEVRETGEVQLALPTGIEFLSTITRTETPTGNPADLTQVRRYGFVLYQDSARPLVWDLDDLRLASSELERAMGEDNFIIRGSEMASITQQLTLMSVLAGADDDEDEDDEDDLEGLRDMLALLNTEFDLSEPSVETAGRFYVAGLPCLQVDDVLYTQQADANDPPLAAPPPGTVRKDTVYLDAWTEPVTYVEDPVVRDVALGGPDTGTRRRVRHRVRVAQGGGVPRGKGIGDGTLATEGVYTAQANRLYRVEVDGAGDIGTATFRWSDDNASTLGRVIEPVPPGSRRVVVEDGAAFHPGDKILLRKELGAEEHEVAAVIGNVITLTSPTGAQLAALPAAGRDPDFTTFALADRPYVQRWQAFRQPIAADAQDATISARLALNDGVAIRFGGHSLGAGDFWTFTTRYLAGDEPAGIDPVTRIERLDFQRARGVIHHYAPLAVLTRDGSSPEPAKIFNVEDRRQRVANAGTTSGALPDLTGLTGETAVHLGSLRLPPSALDSKFVIYWSGDLFLADPPPAGQPANLKLRVGFYSDEATDPATDPETGKIQDREQTVALERRGVGRDIALQLLFSKSDTAFAFLPLSFVPASIHLFAELDREGFTVELTNMQLTALELRKGY